MSVIKFFSVGNGDMAYIDHNSTNFTIIDCCLIDANRERILKEIAGLIGSDEITRFISTHPDDDHIRGLEFLDDRLSLVNFYCVQNKTTKGTMTDSFRRYQMLRDSEKAFHISKDCSRKWMNVADEARGSSGISILWPDLSNESFINALRLAGEGRSPNNISAVIQYTLEGGVTALWMGDLETDFMESESVVRDLKVPKVDLLFASHHGRESGRIPDKLLSQLSPRIIIIGEAPSEELHYYPGYNTITQLTAGDVLFDCSTGEVDVYTTNRYTASYLKNKWRSRVGYFYCGTLEVPPRT